MAEVERTPPAPGWPCRGRSVPFSVLPFAVLSLFRTWILLSCGVSCLRRTWCRSCDVPSSLPQDRLPAFCGTAGQERWVSKNTCSLLRKQGLSGCLLYPSIKYLDFLWRSSRRNFAGCRAAQGQVAPQHGSLLFFLIFVGFWNEHGHRSYLLSSGQALPCAVLWVTSLGVAVDGEVVGEVLGTRSQHHSEQPSVTSGCSRDSKETPGVGGTLLLVESNNH